jgi:serine/alanine adding enzyme
MSDTSLNNHYLQSEQWAVARHGSVWGDQTLVWHDVPLRIYVRSSPLGKVVFIPGFQPPAEDVSDLTAFLRQHYKDAFLCKLEATAPENTQLKEALEQNGWKRGRITQYSHTVQFDLTKPTDVLLKDMKKRARNEMNRARNNGVEALKVEPTDNELDTIYGLLTKTAARKQFSVHDKQFLYTYWRAMRDAGMLRLFQAKKDSQILAAAVIIVSQDGQKAWYKEGGSTQLEPTINAPRLLLWEIAKRLQADGVKTFDLGGIPDPATYERSRMKGIFIFKTAYTPEITKMMPVYELPLKPLKYKFWPKTEVALRKIAQKQGGNWY